MLLLTLSSLEGISCSAAFWRLRVCFSGRWEAGGLRRAVFLGCARLSGEGVCECLSPFASHSRSTVSASRRDCATKARVSSKALRLSWL